MHGFNCVYHCGRSREWIVSVSKADNYACCIQKQTRSDFPQIWPWQYLFGQGTHVRLKRRCLYLIIPRTTSFLILVPGVTRFRKDGRDMMPIQLFDIPLYERETAPFVRGELGLIISRRQMHISQFVQIDSDRCRPGR